MTKQQTRIFELCVHHSLFLSIEQDRVVVDASTPIPARVRGELEELLDYMTVEYNEQAAIKEYDGGMDRVTAEAQARLEVVGAQINQQKAC